MRGPAYRFVAVALLTALVSAAGPHAQQVAEGPPLTPQQLDVVRQFADATTDEARAAIFAAHPWIGDSAGRAAIIDATQVYFRLGDADKAENVYRSLGWLAEAIDSDRARAAALAGLGQVEGQLRGNPVTSLALFQRALAMAESVGDPALLQAPLNNLGILHRRLGNFELASEYFARALAGAEALKRPDMAARVYNNIGTMHYYQGNLGLAREYFDRSVALKEAIGERGIGDLANTVANIGILYLEAGDERQALEYLTRSLALYRKLGRGPAALLTMFQVARAQISLGDIEAASLTMDEAGALADAGGNQASIAQSLFLKGLISRERGELLEAVAFQQQSLALRAKGGEVASLADSHIELSNLLMARQRPTDAEVEARQAMAVAEPRQLLGQLAGAQFHLGRALAAQGRDAEAGVMFERAIETTERIRERFMGEDAARQAFMRQRLGPYTSLAALHARSGRAWDGMQTMEQARARTLLDILSFGRPETKVLRADLRLQERQVTTELTQALQRVKVAERTSPSDAATITALREAYARAQAAHDAFQEQLREAYPRLQLSRGRVPLLASGDLEAVVPAGTAAVQIVTDPDHAWVYVVLGGVDGATVTAHRLSTPPMALIAMGERFARQVSERDLAFAATSRQLYSALFGDIDAQLGDVRRLVIVPDNALWSVPFQALTTPRGRYLVEERALSYAPSLSALAALRARSDARPDRAAMLVALGDPHDAGTPASAVRGPATGQLPEARREVQALGRLYGGRSTVLVGPDATEASLRAVASNASVLHIASHGILDDKGPMFSHLRLAPNRGDDGRLEAWELADLELNADLVVLSACETARGAFGGGEGVIGLSWALLAAGASSAVLSQWEVDSASTTALMIAFHERVLKGDSPAASAPEALRGAALELLKDPRYRHPFYWAGFVVMGS